MFSGLGSGCRLKLLRVETCEGKVYPVTSKLGILKKDTFETESRGLHSAPFHASFGEVLS